ncbi:hypothetical protein CHS0354_026684 [Potamilus streckersoni]|uniref:snRNA-activating protein complex subunit 4 n=1 Tax=Potamilus streckersoni TaxID=2493646 RepID=A0AAE0S802_9BIVA|nr:hypothetical protein CHS0354_026684 [Potamilus streckersoni]
MDSKESFGAESERKKLKEDIERLQLVLQEEDDTEFDSDDNVLQVDTEDEEQDGDTKKFSISHPSTASENQTVSESYESECQELTSIHDLEQWNGDAETCLALNRFYQEALVDQLRKIEYALQENRENQRALEEEMGEKYVKKEKKVGKTKSIADYAIPYFKDKDGNSPQPNEDVLLKKILGEHKQNFQISASWHSTYRKELISAVKQDTLEKILRPCMSRLELEHEKMAKCKDYDEIAACQERIDKINKEIEEKKEMPSEELLSQVDICQVDWMKISAVHLNSRFPSKACEYMWKNALQPSINRSRWTKIEEDALQRLVEKYEMHNWESIAKELATNRTPFQCLQHYQQHLAKSEKGDWTAEEDDLLKEVVDTCRGGQLTIQWNQVAYYLDGRSAEDCKNRWIVLDPTIRRGKWTEQENCMLIAAVKLLGPNNWQRIKEFVPGRTSLQCRERWNNSLNPKLKHRCWSYDEDKKMLELVQQKGGKWSEIAAMLEGRTDNQVLQRYRRLQEWQKWTDEMEKQPDYVKDQLLSSFSKEKLKRIQEIKIASDTVKNVRESAAEEFQQELQEIANRIRDSNMEISEMDYIRQQIDKETGSLVVPRPPLLKRYSVRKFSQTWKRREQLQSLIGFHVDKALEKNQIQDLKAVAQEATRNVRPVAEIKGHDKWRLINHALKDKNPHEFTVREILDLSRQLADTGEIHPFEDKTHVNRFTVKKHGRSQHSFIKHNDLSRKLRKALQCHSDKKYLRRRSQTGRPRKFYLFSYKGHQHPDTELCEEEQDAASKTITVVLMKALGVDYKKIFSVVKSLTPDAEGDSTRTTVKRSKRRFYNFSKADGEEWEQELLPSYLVEDMEFVRGMVTDMEESEIELVDTKETHENLPCEIKSLVDKRMLRELPPHIRYRQESACSNATKDKLKELITGVKKKVVEGSNLDSQSRDTDSLTGDKKRQVTGTEQTCYVYPSTSRSKSLSQSTVYNKQETCLTTGQSQKLSLSNSTMKPLISRGKSLEAYIVYPPIKKHLSSENTTHEVPNEPSKRTVQENVVYPRGTQRPVETKSVKEVLTTRTEYIVYPPSASTMNVQGTSLMQRKEPTNPHCREKPINTESRPFRYDKSWSSEKIDEPIYVPVNQEIFKPNIQTYMVYPSKPVNSNKEKVKGKTCNILEDPKDLGKKYSQVQDKRLDMHSSNRQTKDQNSKSIIHVTSKGQNSCTNETDQSRTQNWNQTQIKISHHGVVSQSNSGSSQSNKTCCNSEVEIGANKTSKQMGKDGYVTQEEDIIMVHPDCTRKSISNTSNHDGQAVQNIIVPSNGQTIQVTQSCREGNQIVSSVEQTAVSANMQLSQVTRSSNGSKHVRTIQETALYTKTRKTFSLPYLPPNVTNMFGFRSLLLKRRGLIHDARYWYNDKYYKKKSRTIANENDPDLTIAMNEKDELADEKDCVPKKREKYVYDKLHHLRGTPHFEELRERFKALFTWCALMSAIYPPVENDFAHIKQPSVAATTVGDPAEGIQEGISNESSGINQTVNQIDSLSEKSYKNSKQGKNKRYPLAKAKRSCLKKTVAEKRATQQQRAFLKGKDRSPVKKKPGRPKGFKMTKPYQKRPCPPPREGSQRQAALKVREEAEQKLHEKKMKKEENKKKKELRILLPRERVAKRVSDLKDLFPSVSKRRKMETDVCSNIYMTESSMEASLDSFEECSESVGNTSIVDSVVTLNLPKGDEVEMEIEQQPNQENQDNGAPHQNGDMNSTKTTEAGGGDQGISLVSLPVSKRTDTNQEFVLIPMIKDDRQITMAIPVVQALSMLSKPTIVNTGLQDNTQITVITAMQAAATAPLVKQETGNSSNT